MERYKVSNGVWFVRIPEADLSVLCGCPPDVVKHLMRRGLVAEASKRGTVYESGPNAILLSDVAVQGGSFSNMTEFPLLQMFYRQGMILPGHVNNTGRKPLIIGLLAQIQAQSAYVATGTYGLENEEELVAAGVRQDLAAEIMRYKLLFAHGKLKGLGEIAEFAPTDSGRAELPGGVTILRKGLNLYSFRRGDEVVEVDMNLAPGESYESPVRHEFHRVDLDYFSVVHSGEGNGWDKDRPCMSSIVVFQGRIYLIDTGPYVLDSLTALGISVNEIEGIFHTHAHDDHFAGLTSLVRTDHRIKYYAAPLVRAAVMKKLSAVMNLPERRFSSAFEFHDLELGRWNEVEGLEVQPVLSLHPVETTVLFFRARSAEGPKTYAHLADIPPFPVLEEFFQPKPGADDLSERLRESMSRSLLQPVDLKKIDSGGGMIHGRAVDFEGDQSRKIVLSHIAGELSAAEKEIGSNASFGQQDVLIESRIDYAGRAAERHLSAHFPEVPPRELGPLLNCPLLRLNPGHVILRKGGRSAAVYLIANGVVETIDAKAGVEHMLSAGTMIGHLDALSGQPSRRTYRARSSVTALEIPAELFEEFAKRNYDPGEMKRLLEIELFLQGTRLFGEMISSAVQLRVARSVSAVALETGAPLPDAKVPSIVVSRTGELRISIDACEVDRVGSGGFYGEESLFLDRPALMSAEVVAGGEFLYVPAAAIRDVPIVEWKLLEEYDRRITRFGSQQAERRA
ncbi:MAG: cyclic nucleotide-binding domain-containing protein [Spirochaetaceae bacterium]|nr:cyclic nucleotide-binding domain-containing protein [Spirochaetaceae bacterium]